MANNKIKFKVVTEELPLSKLKPNNKNPRFIRDKQFENLCKSLTNFPEMKQIREIVCDENMNILAGNM